LHDKDDSNCGEGKLSGSEWNSETSFGRSEVDLTDLNGVGLPNYSLWDYLTLRIPNQMEAFFVAEAFCNSHVRREDHMYNANYESGLTLFGSGSSHHAFMDILQNLKISRVLVRASPLAIANPGRAKRRSAPLTASSLVAEPTAIAMAEAAEVRRKFHLPDLWFTPFVVGTANACDMKGLDSLVCKASHLLPLPIPYAHIVVCWDADHGSFVLFDSEARRDVGSYEPIPQYYNPDSSRSQMMYVLLSSPLHVFELF
jgi:hypothetical protein